MDILLLNKFFEKSSSFEKKKQKRTAKNYLWEDLTVLGEGRLGTKINVKFFVGNEV